MRTLLSRGLALAVLTAGATGSPASAADAVVGTGTPASCTEAALDAALLTVTSGSGGTMTFSCGPAPHTILVTGEEVVFGDVTLQGDGRITLSGGLGTRILHVLTPAHVFLDGMAFERGFASGAGGAIFVDGTGTVSETRLYLKDSTIQGSFSLLWGGGIAAKNATLSLSTSAVNDNLTSGGGGGINLNNGTLQLMESRLSGNLAGGNGGAVEHWTGELIVVGTMFFDNETQTDADTTSGGALSIRNLSLASIERSQLLRNVSEVAGGGVHVWGTTDLVMQGTEIADNRVPGGVGGGIYVAATASLEGHELTVAGNQAVQGGGIEGAGGFALSNSTISGNVATGGSGGGISASAGFEILHVTIAGNRAASGGGLWSDSSSPAPQLINVLFSGNTATAGPANCDWVAPPGQLLFSLWPDTTCGSSSTGSNHPNTVVNVAPLAYSCSAISSVETTRTHALPAGAAVDVASCVLPSLAMDQRSVARPQGAGCDIGAVERSATPSCNALFRDGFDVGTTYRWSTLVLLTDSRPAF